MNEFIVIEGYAVNLAEVAFWEISQEDDQGMTIYFRSGLTLGFDPELTSAFLQAVIEYIGDEEDDA